MTTAFKPLEVSFVLKPNDPQDQESVEDLTDDAEVRLAAAVEAAGFTIIVGPDCREAA